MHDIVVVPLTAAPPELFGASRCAEGSLAWFQTLAATTLAPREEAVLAVLRESGVMRAALPLVRTPQGARALTAPYTTQYVPAFPSPEAAYELGLRARNYAGDVLRLEALAPECPEVAAYLSGLAASGLAVAQYEGFANWHEPLTGFDAYWHARPSRLRSTVRRKFAAASRAGAAFECVRADFGTAIAAYEEIYRSSWKTPEPHPAFISTMIRTLARQDLVRLGVMSLSGHAVAAQIWLVSGGCGTIFKLAHREDVAEYSPGTLLTFWMAQTLIRDDGVTEIDFGRGDDGYKRDWVSQRRTRIGVIAADWRRPRGLVAMATDIFPTLGARALRRHLGGNRKHSVEAV